MASDEVPDEPLEAEAADDGLPFDPEAVEALAYALAEAGANITSRDPQTQARRWHRERSIRLEGSTDVLRILLAAIGFPTLEAPASEFSVKSFDPDGIDKPVTVAIRRTVKAILADLEAAAKAPWPTGETSTTEVS